MLYHRKIYELSCFLMLQFPSKSLPSKIMMYLIICYSKTKFTGGLSDNQPKVAYVSMYYK